jgi:hypothetical protein
MTTHKKHRISRNSQKLFKNSEPEVQKLVSDIISRCEEHNIVFIAHHCRFKDGNLGLFNAGNAYLMICTKNDDWISTLIHESCHMDQYAEQAKVYRGWATAPDVFKWMWGDLELSRRQSSIALHKYQEIELDCEKRTLKKINEYGLTHLINVDRYVRMSNFCIMMYGAAKVLKDFPRTKRPKAWNYKMWSGMPNKLLPLEKYKRTPKWFVEEIRTML